MEPSKIPVYGAGPLGSILTARLFQAGQDVRLLSRGAWLEQIRKHGIMLHDVITDRTIMDPVPVVETIAPEDDYDLVLVVMGRNHVLASLPALAQNKRVETYLFPTLAPALRTCSRTRLQMVNTRDAMLLYIRSLRESFRVLRALGIRVLPPRMRYLSWLPEPILLLILRKVLSNDLMETAMDRHAEAAQPEIKQRQDEFRVLVEKSSIPTPCMNKLAGMVEAGETFSPGSRAIRMRLF